MQYHKTLGLQCGNASQYGNMSRPFHLRQSPKASLDQDRDRQTHSQGAWSVQRS